MESVLVIARFKLADRCIPSQTFVPTKPMEVRQSLTSRRLSSAPSLISLLLLREERKFPSSPATAKITKVGLQLYFGWAHAHPGNRLSNLIILARYLFHFWLDSSCYEKRLFSELRTSRRNPHLKTVDYVIHGKLRDSRKTTWFTENYVIHAAPVETT